MTHPTHLDELAGQCKALAEPTRLRILILLREGERCVCDLMAALDMGQSKVSRHLTVLRNAGWVGNRRGGKWTYYRLSDTLDTARADMLQTLFQALGHFPEIREDDARLRSHLATKTNASCN